jgi:hypothetical protein
MSPCNYNALPAAFVHTGNSSEERNLKKKNEKDKKKKKKKKKKNFACRPLY